MHELTQEEIYQQAMLYDKHKLAVRAECDSGELDLQALMRKHARIYADDAILAEARERTLRELRAYKSN